MSAWYQAMVSSVSSRIGRFSAAADEAALLERGDQAVDAGFRPQVERILHLVEGGRHAVLLQAAMDEVQKIVLLARKHRGGFLPLSLLTF